MMSFLPITAAEAQAVGAQRKYRVPFGLSASSTLSKPTVVQDVGGGNVIPTSHNPSIPLTHSKSCLSFGHHFSGSLAATASTPASGASEGIQQPQNPWAPHPVVMIPRAASAPSIMDVGEALGCGAQAVVCQATLSSAKFPVALVIGKQPIPDTTRHVLHLLATKRQPHVVSVFHPDMLAQEDEQSADTCSAVTSDAFAIHRCTCSLADLLERHWHRCTRAGFQAAVQHLVAQAEQQSEDTWQAPDAPPAVPLPGGVSEAFLAALARHIVLGLRGMHSLCVTHNDIKLSNVLFDVDTGCFMLGDLLNATLVASPRNDGGRDAPASPGGCGAIRTLSTLRRSRYRSDYKQFAVLLAQVARLCHKYEQEEHLAARLDTESSPAARCYFANRSLSSESLLQIADGSDVTGCLDWVEWDQMERFLDGVRLSPRCIAFIKLAFLGPQRHPPPHDENQWHVLADRGRLEAEGLLAHDFLSHDGRNHLQWKQLLKAAFGDDGEASGIMTASSPREEAGLLHSTAAVLLELLKQSSTASSGDTCRFQRGSNPPTPLVSSPTFQSGRFYSAGGGSGGGTSPQSGGTPASFPPQLPFPPAATHAGRSSSMPQIRQQPRR